MLTPMDFLPSDALARLLEQSRMSVQTGTKGTTPPEDEEDDDFHGGPTQQADYSRSMRGLVGLRFCAAVYGSAGRAEGLVAASFAGWALHTAPWGNETLDVASALAAAVKSCAPRITEVPGLAERLATSTYTSVRIALAQALPKSEVGVLQALARDANRDVREAANKRLDASLRSDAFPISTEGHDEAVLAKARHILELATHQYGKHAADALDAMQPLSDKLAIAVWERLLLAGHVSGAQFWLWLGALLERPGGEHAFVRLLAQWYRTEDSYYVAYNFEKIGEVSTAARKRTANALLLALKNAPNEGYLGSQIAQCASRLVTPRYDRMKLLEAVLGVPIEQAAETKPDYRYPSHEFAKPLAKMPMRGPLREVLTAALHDGKRGRWKHVPQAVWVRLGADPLIRAQARESLATVEASKRYELVATLLQHRIAKLDGTKTKLVEDLYANADLRPALIRLTKLGKALARRSLLRGELSIEAICELVPRGIEGRTAASPQSKRLWEAVRKARDAALAEAFTFDLCALIRPGDSFDASDLPVAQRGCAALMGNDPRGGNVAAFLNALAGVQSEDSREMRDELAEKSEKPGVKQFLEGIRELEELRRERDA